MPPVRVDDQGGWRAFNFATLEAIILDKAMNSVGATTALPSHSRGCRSQMCWPLDRLGLESLRFA